MLYGPPPSWYGTPQCTSLLRLLSHDQALDKQQKGMDGWMDGCYVVEETVPTSSLHGKS